MAAPNLETLLDVESEVEAAFGTYLGTTLSMPVVKSDSDTILETPRAEIVATVSEFGPHQYSITSGIYAGRRIYDQIRVSLQIDMVYSPAIVQSPGTLRGKLRKALTDYTGIQTNLSVNGYLMLASDSLRQTGGSRSIDTDNNTATISSTIDLVVFINPSAIPLA